MDASSLLTALLSSSSIQNISSAAKASTADVKKVLMQAVPVLLQGVSNQANNKATSAGFQKALAQHAQDGTKQLDLTDGSKIISHLLSSSGTTASAATGQIAKAAGVSKAATSSILAAAAPLLMSVLGQQSSGTNANALGGLMSGLLGGSNMSSLLGSLLGGASSAASQTQASSANSASNPKPASSNSGAGSLLGGLMGLLK